MRKFFQSSFFNLPFNGTFNVPLNIPGLISAFFLLGILGIMNSGCSLKDGPESPAASIKIILEKESTPSQFSTPHPLFFQSASENWFSSKQVTTAPTTLSDFNCFIANVTGSGVPVDSQMTDCTISGDPSGQGFGATSNPAISGQTMEANVTTGFDRRVDVYGIYPPVSECGGSGSGADNIGYFLGGVVADILGSTSITVPIAYSAGSSGNVTCDNQTDLSVFGNGTDGDATITTPVTDTATDTMVLGGGNYLAAARQISNITGTTLTLASAFAATEYSAGDEIIWYVTSTNTGLGSVCSTVSGDLYPGRYGFAKIATATPGSTIDLVAPFVSDSASHSLGASCLVQIVRVPNFNNVTISNPIAVTAPALVPGTGVGGVFAMRIAGTLTYSAVSTGSISANAKGFRGSVGTAGQQGDTYKVGGATISASANLSGGGGGASQGGGGGGNQGSGGAGDSGGAGGAISPCEGAGCMFLGSGGGSGGMAASNGGNGGGLLFIMAKNITVTNTGTLEIDASGAVGSGGGSHGGGGGAGGNVIIKSQTISLGSGGLNLKANGGLGSSVVLEGGGGGGGGVFLEYCSLVGGTYPSPQVIGGLAGGVGAVDGSIGYSTGSGYNGSYSFCP